MCDQLSLVNTAISSASQPPPGFVAKLQRFLHNQAATFEPCLWTAVAGSWHDAVAAVEAAAANPAAWPTFQAKWATLYGAIVAGCCPTARWVVTATPPDGPWGGAAVCTPTTTPHSRVQRTYGSRAECEMAVQLLSPQDSPLLTNLVTCNNGGCQQRVRWAPMPNPAPVWIPPYHP